MDPANKQKMWHNAAYLLITVGDQLKVLTEIGHKPVRGQVYKP